VSTNYFDHSQAAKGLIFASANAGSVRLLIPDNQLGCVPEMETAHMVVITGGIWQGRQAMEIMFDDYSDTPFVLYAVVEMMDRRFSTKDVGRTFPISAWGRTGKLGEWRGGYRVKKQLPCLKPWKARK